MKLKSILKNLKINEWSYEGTTNSNGGNVKFSVEQIDSDKFKLTVSDIDGSFKKEYTGDFREIMNRCIALQPNNDTTISREFQ